MEPRPPSRTSLPPSRRLELTGAGGIVLAADAYGEPDRPPVLLLHGGGQTRHAWGATAGKLAAAGFHAVTLDLRGHGESEWAADGDYEIATFAADVYEVAMRFPSKPALVGASLGGIASIICEHAHPVASAVVLVDITPKMDPVGVQKIVGFMNAFPEGFEAIEHAADAIAEYLPHRPRPADTSGLAKNLRLGDDGRWRWHWDPRFLSDSPRSKHHDYPERMNAAVRSLSVPTLLVRGRMSEIVSEEGVRDFLEMVPHAEYVDVEDASHMVAGDRNDVFCEAVIDFLSRTVLAAQT
ncbi:MAG TPA: alpha/beta hydrolase [Candidatus Limnocylindrales bacterium]|nr:alpha/beta hydrolase [Candidatus Limnocylindrales bacterium]